MNVKTLKERLREGEIGRPYIDEKHAFRISGSGVELPFVVYQENVSKVGLNDFVIIRDLARDCWIGGQIDEIVAPDPGKGERLRDLYDTGRKRMAELEDKKIVKPARQIVKVRPICLFEERENEEWERTPSSVCPSTTSMLLLPTVENEWNEPTIHDILDLPAEGVRLGVLSQGQKVYEDPETGKTIDYYLPLEEMRNEHLMVLGSTGTGKTVFLKELAISLWQKNRSVGIFDLQGDIIQIAEPPSKSQLEEVREEREERKIWEGWGWLTKGEAYNSSQLSDLHDHLKIFLPVLEDKRKYDSEQVKLLKRWATDHGIKNETFTLAFGKVPSGDQFSLYMPGLTAKAQGGLSPLFEYYSDRFAGKLDYFIDWLDREKDQRGRRYCWEDEEGNTIVRLHKASYGNLIRELSRLKGKGVFDVEGEEEPDWPKEFDKDQVNIIYLRHLPTGLHPIYEFHIPLVLFENKMELPPTSIIIDEAHTVIPKRTRKEEYASRVVNIFTKMAREGRKYGIQLVVSTHKPRDINPKVYDLCGTEVTFRITKEDAKIAGIPTRYRSDVTQYVPGYARINSPETSRVPWIEVKFPRTRRLHQEPKPFLKEIKKQYSY